MMIKSKNLLSAIALLLFFSCSDAQNSDNKEEPETNSEISSNSINEKAKENFKAKYPQAEDVEWGTDSNGYYEASFKQNGKKLRADFTKDGSWLETEESIKYDELPAAVQKVIEADYDKDDISELEKVDHNREGTFYDIEFQQKGKNKDVQISPTGEIIPERKK